MKWEWYASTNVGFVYCWCPHDGAPGEATGDGGGGGVMVVVVGVGVGDPPLPNI